MDEMLKCTVYSIAVLATLNSIETGSAFAITDLDFFNWNLSGATQERKNMNGIQWSQKFLAVSHCGSISLWCE